VAASLEDIRKTVFGLLAPLTVLPGVDATKIGMDVMQAVKEYGDLRYEAGKSDGEKLALLGFAAGYLLAGKE